MHRTCDEVTFKIDQPWISAAGIGSFSCGDGMAGIGLTSLSNLGYEHLDTFSCSSNSSILNIEGTVTGIKTFMGSYEDSQTGKVVRSVVENIKFEERAQITDPVCVDWFDDADMNQSIDDDCDIYKDYLHLPSGSQTGGKYFFRCGSRVAGLIFHWENGGSFKVSCSESHASHLDEVSKYQILLDEYYDEKNDQTVYSSDRLADQ